MLPPELRWQSGRLLTDRSLVRSQVVAHYFGSALCFGFTSLQGSVLLAFCSAFLFCFSGCGPPTLNPVYVLVAQLDKASDYESEDWGFKSLQGYFSLHGLMDKAHPS